MPLVVLALAGSCLILYLYWKRKRTNDTAELSTQLLEQAAKRATALVDEAKASIGQYRREEEEKLLEAQSKLEKERISVASKEAELARERQKVQQSKQELEKKERLLQQQMRQLHDREAVLNLTKEEAKAKILLDAQKEAERDYVQIILDRRNQAEEAAQIEADKLIATVLNRLPEKPLQDASISHVSLPSEEMKAKIIGREGKNIKAFQQITGVNLIVDDTPLTATLSSFDLQRREIARLALVELVRDGRISVPRIEEEVALQSLQLDQLLLHRGMEAAHSVDVHGLHPELLRLLGKCSLRTSFGQNLLEHSVEVANIMGLMAAELKLDTTRARRMGLLHDIGKVALDSTLSHARLSHKLCLEYGESEEVANGVGCHHDEMAPKTYEGSLVKCADYLSGARLGARAENRDSFFSRLRDLEKLALEFTCVKSAFAINSGRELQVFVRPETCDELEAVLLAKQIAQKIQPLTSPHKVQISVIRETKLVEYS